MSELQFPESMVGGITDGGKIGLSEEAHNSALGLKHGKPKNQSGHLSTERHLDTADEYLGDALSRLERNLVFAESDLETLQNKIALREKEIEHYKAEIAKLKAIIGKE